MPFDRADALRTAEKCLRQGKLDRAIAEYRRVIEEQPRDLNTANLLGDLYLRADQPEKAVEQFSRFVADTFMGDGFLPKAGALYKKVLRIRPDDEHALLQTADIAVAQGLLADARRNLKAVAEQRRSRGDRAGADRIVMRLGALDPADHDARHTAARARVSLGEVADGVADLRTLAADLVGAGRIEQALLVLQEAAAAQAGDDSRLLLSMAEIRVREGRIDDGLALVDRAVEQDPLCLRDVALLAASVASGTFDDGFRMVSHVVDGAVGRLEWMDAAVALEVFLNGSPHQVPALLRLVEICVDGHLDDLLISVQARLADAYLDVGLSRDARVIAEDLVSRRPGDEAHVERLRRALIMLGVSDVDAATAEVLSRQDLLTDASFVGDEVSVAPASGPVEMRDELREAPSTERFPQRGGEEVDLTVVLDEIRKPAAAPVPSGDLEGVFARLRDQASERLAIDESEQDLRRGIALWRAGQTDESMLALQAASKAPRQRAQAALALGRILRDRGRLRQAIDWFERGAEVPAPAPEMGHELLYELADALESAGEFARALAICLELEAEAGVFRDLPARIERLAKAQERE